MQLETISLLFSINSSYLSRLFKKETGRNLTEYINLCRVDKSKHMLRDSNKLIYQIAEESGFSSVEHFTRMFKRIVGKSPSEFRKYRMP